MVLEPPLLDAPAEEHAAVSAPMAASAAVARSERGRWSKRIVQSSPAVGGTFLHYFAGDAKQLGAKPHRGDTRYGGAIPPFPPRLRAARRRRPWSRGRTGCRARRRSPTGNACTCLSRNSWHTRRFRRDGGRPRPFRG